MTATTPQTYALSAADGFALAITRYDAAGDAPCQGSLIVAGATGVPQRFYRRFAEYASAQGFSVFTFDYRGIGQSRPDSLKGFEMDYLDWARLDLAAVVEHVAEQAAPLFMVGHSFGGHAFGLLPNHQRVARFYTFGTGAGWHGWMPPMERLKVRAMWPVLTLLTRIKGYSPWSMLGLGEDLPRGVFYQWRHWCRFPHYFFDDPAMTHLADQFAQVRTPMIVANALDDLWALPRSRDAFIKAYSQAPLTCRDIDPRAGLGPVGHMGYFRPKARPLWDDVLAWFREHHAIAAPRPVVEAESLS